MPFRKFTFARLLFAAACLCASPAFADNLIGQASIIDGDTLEIHGTRIRVWGIDAPESSQLCRNDESLQYRCGAKAANELDAFIARRPVDCLALTYLYLPQSLRVFIQSGDMTSIGLVVFSVSCTIIGGLKSPSFESAQDFSE